MIEIQKAKEQYAQQKARCGCRVDALGNPIRFLLSFEEWLSIWESSGHYNKRGKRNGEYCMSRYNDVGDYVVGNVFIQLTSDNREEAHKGARRSNETKHNLRVANGTKIMTPLGRFESITAAKIAYGRSLTYIQNRLKDDPTHFYRI